MRGQRHSHTHSHSHSEGHRHSHHGDESSFFQNFPYSESEFHTHDYGHGRGRGREHHFHGRGFHPHPHGFAPRGFHWLGLGVLATTLVRKGKGEAVFWFGLGALVTSVFLKHRLAYRERFGGPRDDAGPWGGRFGFGRRGGRKGVSWKLSVVADADIDDEAEGEKKGEEEGAEGCRECAAKASGGVCSCGYVERSEGEVLFEAPRDAEEEKPAEAAKETTTDAQGAPAAPSLEQRLDSLAGSIDDLKFHVEQLATSARSRAASTSSSGLDVGAAFAENFHNPAPF